MLNKPETWHISYNKISTAKTMDSDEILLEASEKMEKAVDHTLHEFSTLHTGKASPSMLDSILVSVESYGGASSHIKDLAAITTPDPRTIQIQPWDKSVVRDIERGIQKANLGFNPVIDGNIIRINIPELSGDRRKELVKIAHSMAEDGRVRVRHARHDAIDALRSMQKNSEISEDDLKRHEKEVQTETDKAVSEINNHLTHRENELTTI